MKTLITLVLILFTSVTHAQIKATCFTGVNAYLVKDKKTIGPIANKDAVIFDITNERVVILSEMVKIYKILNTITDFASNGNPFIEYLCTDSKGNKMKFTFIKLNDERYPQLTSRVIMESPDSFTYLDGYNKDFK